MDEICPRPANPPRWTVSPCNSLRFKSSGALGSSCVAFYPTRSRSWFQRFALRNARPRMLRIAGTLVSPIQRTIFSPPDEAENSRRSTMFERIIGFSEAMPGVQFAESLPPFAHLQKKGESGMMPGNPDKSQDPQVDAPMTSAFADHHQRFAERNSATTIVKNPRPYENNKRQADHQQNDNMGQFLPCQGVERKAHHD